MKVEKKYDVFCKEPFLQKYPNFQFLLKEVDLSKININADQITRYIVYLYNVECPLFKELYSFDDMKIAALEKVRASKSLANKPEFLKAENLMAYRFMTNHADVDFELYVSSKVRHSFLCMQLRDTTASSTWKDANDSITAQENLEALGGRIKAMEDRLFGNIEELKKVLDQNKSENMGAAEKYAMN